MKLPPFKRTPAILAVLAVLAGVLWLLIPQDVPSGFGDSAESLGGRWHFAGAGRQPGVDPPGGAGSSVGGAAPDTPLRPLRGVGPVRGAPFKLAPDTLNPQTLKGRIRTLGAWRPQDWDKLREGAVLALPSFEGVEMVGDVNLRMEDRGWLRFGGGIRGGGGSFHLNVQSGRIAGMVLDPQTGRALEIRTEPSGEVLLIERPLSRFVCWPGLPTSAAAPEAAGASVGSAAAGPVAVPPLNTRPGARGLIYINFEGELVTDPVWNQGRTISAEASRLSADEIREVVARVAEDYAPFDMTVTTIRAEYDAAPVGRRMRVIVTPTTTALPNSGGVAMVDSWSAAGETMSSTVPAWVFNSTPKTVGEGVSHEVGHTLGLNHDGVLAHDGSPASPYYSGHGGDQAVPSSWGPIMGMSYYRSVTQWSRGEYAYANNTEEDDLAIIAKEANGVGYASDVEAGVLAGGVTSLKTSAGAFEMNAVLRRSDAADVYGLRTLGGAFAVSAKLANSKYANADLLLELHDEAGALLAFSDPKDAREAALARELPAGTYRIRVSGAGTEPPPVGGYTAGYSSYGSVGGYVLAGTAENVVPSPELASSTAANGVDGRAFFYKALPSTGASIQALDGDLPPGVTWDPASSSLAGIPTVCGIWSPSISIVLGQQRVTRILKITIDAEALPLPVLSPDWVAAPVTTPEAPWSGQAVLLPNGQRGIAAGSGRVANGGVSKLRFSVPGRAVLQFWWRTSSEAGHDIARCRLNGAVALDAVTNRLLSLSGETGWVKQTIKNEGTGPTAVEFGYSKDASLSDGLDRVWISNITVSTEPIITQNPQPQWLPVGHSVVGLNVGAEGAVAFQWKKDSIPLSDVSSELRQVSGANARNLKIVGATSADSGSYTVDVIGADMTVSSRPVSVSVAGPPVITQKLYGPQKLQPGDTLFLNLGVSGVKPLFVLWKKNDEPLRWTQTTTLVIPNASPAEGGSYHAVVVNPYGHIASEKVLLSISADPAN